MSQGKLNGLASNLSNYNTASQPGANLAGQIAQQGVAPQPNQSQVGEFGNSFGQPSPNTPYQPSPSGQHPLGGSQAQIDAWNSLQGLVQQGNQMFGQSKQSNAGSLGSPVAPQPPTDSSLAQGPGPNFVAPGPVPPTNLDGLNSLPGPDNYATTGTTYYPGYRGF